MLSGYFKSAYISPVFLVLLVTIQHAASTTLTDVLIPETFNAHYDTPFPFLAPIRLARETKYPRYANGNSDKTLKPEDSADRDNSNAPPGKRCISCFTSYASYPSYDRPRYDDTRTRDRDYDRYDDRDRYYERDRYYDRDRYNDRYDRYSDRDRYTRGRDRYGDRDRYNDPYDYDRYDPYERNDRYDRDRYDRYDRDRYDRYSDRGVGNDRYSDRGVDRYSDRGVLNDRYSDRGVGYDNRGYDYKSDPYRSSDEHYRGYTSGRPDYGTSGYASRWNYGGSDNGRGRDDPYRDR